MKINPIQALDFYKVGHKFQYPQGTEKIYSNFTPRSNKLAPSVRGQKIDKVVVFGLQGFIKWFMVDLFQKEFFDKPKAEVIAEYDRMTANGLGTTVDSSHIAALHDLGYLPITIKAIPEGSRVKMGVPVMKIWNTNKRFFWLTNHLETVISDSFWKSCTIATIADAYRRLLTEYAVETGSPLEFVDWQGHDFSMRGMSCVYDAAANGAGHLLSFLGTDTVPAINYIEDYYGGRNTFVGGSVAATEHSVMCAGGMEDERDTIKRLITEIYPSGIISIVSDTWDYWNTVTNIYPSLKEEILAREPNALGIAKVVVRPDSGDPVKIVCGDPEAEPGSPEFKGTVECLWETFGGTVTSKGYRVLNERIGVIYGDSITLERAEQILEGLKQKGFASCNIVFGIGSFTYQYLTRDTFGFAMKATLATINGVDKPLQKDPKTGDSTKKSAKGYLAVYKDSAGNWFLEDNVDEADSLLDDMLTVFHNGSLPVDQNIQEMRAILRNS